MPSSSPASPMIVIHLMMPVDYSVNKLYLFHLTLSYYSSLQHIDLIIKSGTDVGSLSRPSSADVENPMEAKRRVDQRQATDGARFLRTGDIRTRMPPQFLIRSGKKKIANLPISREKMIYVKLPDTNEYIPIGFGERDVAEAFGCPGKYVDDY